MTHKTNNLPYFNQSQELSRSKSNKEHMLAKFLLRKIKPRLKEKLPEHYMIQSVLHKNIDFIKEKSKSYPYFLRFDIRLYYPSINHALLIKEIETMFGKEPTRRMKKHLKDILPKYLSSSPYGQGISIGSTLSYVLSGAFLLNLDLKIPRPFLRFVDDYLIFCKNRKEAETILGNVVTPELKRLNLEINEKKLKSGNFHKDKVDFIGFDYYASYFTIKESKKENFKNNIIKITHLTKKKPAKAIIKQLNNQILGFGHYYKHTSCKKDFEELDSFIRMRLRRYLSRNKDSKNTQENLLLTNNTIKNIGLKSLVEIKEKYDSKKNPISQKTTKKTTQSGKTINVPNVINIGNKVHIYEQKLILKELNQLTSLVKRINKRIERLEYKVANNKKTER